MRSNVSDVLPPAVKRSLAKFGGDLAIARRKRGLTVLVVAERMGVAKNTYLRAQYGAGCLGQPARFALGPTLPLQVGPQFHRKSRDGSIFHAAIADTEPDGWAKRVIMRDHIKRRQELRREGKEEEAQPLNALDYL